MYAEQDCHVATERPLNHDDATPTTDTHLDSANECTADDSDSDYGEANPPPKIKPMCVYANTTLIRDYALQTENGQPLEAVALTRKLIEEAMLKESNKRQTTIDNFYNV